ncbi:Hypothetical predicted protein [Pelobates cultripes]|uniref:Uncharacterized protein n=1 Tax=Pelobates cultripes TaxID=61616 RepID=A0AAD1SP78_PELCU|nr:Hypothetical predicted protein [Pelobates cultripes]
MSLSLESNNSTEHEIEYPSDQINKTESQLPLLKEEFHKILDQQLKIVKEELKENFQKGLESQLHLINEELNECFTEIKEEIQQMAVKIQTNEN